MTLIRFHYLLAIAMILGMACVVAPAHSVTKRLRVSTNGRSIVTIDGAPFFWMGDTNWRLYKLKREDVDAYLDDRLAKGFNVIQGPVLLHSNGGNEATNGYGHTNTDPVHPDLSWFEHIDYIINAAEQRGMYVAPAVVWGDSYQALGSSQVQRVANATSLGEWLGFRYRDRTNVIWIVAGEYGITGVGPNITQVWNALGEGLRTGSSGNALITIHPSSQEGRQSSSLLFQNAHWLSFNMTQSGQSGNWGPGASNWQLVHGDYSLAPITPVLDGEAHYEGLVGWNAFGVRRRAYWSVFAGGFGHTYGSISVALSYRGGNDNGEGATETWLEALDLSGASDMKHLRALMESRPMLTRIPANNMLITPSGGVPVHMIASRDQLGRYAMIYVPRKGKSLTVNTNSINGSQTRAWWYDCRNGAAHLAGMYPHGGIRTFTTPNSGKDWVLVLDDSSQGYSMPGVGGPLP